MKQQVRELLAKPLITTDNKQLAEQLASLEALAAELCMEYRAACEELADMRGKLYDPSLKTELERRVDLERNTRTHRQSADELGDLVELVKQRIELGKVLLQIK